MSATAEDMDATAANFPDESPALLCDSIDLLPTEILSVIFAHAVLGGSHALAISQRIKEIDLALHRPPDTLSTLASLNLPHLQTLSLRPWKGNLEHPPHPYIFNYAQNSPAGSTSPLRHLHFRDILFDIQAPYFAYLRTLDVRMVFSVNESMLIETYDLLAALEQMHHLESLELVGALKPSKPDRSFARSVSLPSLSNVRLEVSKSECLTLFSHLSCESIQSVVTQADWYTTPVALASVAAEIYSLIPIIPGVPWSIDATVSFSQSMSNSTFGLDIFNTIASKNLNHGPFRISFRGTPDFEALCSRLPTECRSPSAFVYEPDYDQSDAEYCSIDISRSRALFQSPTLADVENICVYRVRDLLSLLINPPPQSDLSSKDNTPTSSSSPVFFPSVKHVVCIESVPPHYRSKMLEEIAQLEPLLRARRLERLSVHLIGRCIKESDVEALRKHVGILEFSTEDEDMFK
ncbi:hypothetical protein ONZ45_g18941 [Pleurotus djamor]|nr:hypothetical protein ONZ45_g18941 [Pleurotus djamor]